MCRPADCLEFKELWRPTIEFLPCPELHLCHARGKRSRFRVAKNARHAPVGDPLSLDVEIRHVRHEMESLTRGISLVKPVLSRARTGKIKLRGSDNNTASKSSKRNAPKSPPHRPSAPNIFITCRIAGTAPSSPASATAPGETGLEAEPAPQRRSASWPVNGSHRARAVAEM